MYFHRGSYYNIYINQQHGEPGIVINYNQLMIDFKYIPKIFDKIDQDLLSSKIKHILEIFGSFGDYEYYSFDMGENKDITYRRTKKEGYYLFMICSISMSLSDTAFHKINSIHITQKNGI